mmetsp:Transcript_21159/g.59206  ORF Transcript_21159/g.59206 Transcript_21159/m.59206 type:complete len:230 (+) Transcript_21159:1104-1793(+)
MRSARLRNSAGNLAASSGVVYWDKSDLYVETTPNNSAFTLNWFHPFMDFAFVSSSNVPSSIPCSPQSPGASQRSSCRPVPDRSFSPQRLPPISLSMRHEESPLVPRPARPLAPLDVVAPPPRAPSPPLKTLGPPPLLLLPPQVPVAATTFALASSAAAARRAFVPTGCHSRVRNVDQSRSARGIECCSGSRVEARRRVCCATPTRVAPQEKRYARQALGGWVKMGLGGA